MNHYWEPDGRWKRALAWIIWFFKQTMLWIWNHIFQTVTRNNSIQYQLNIQLGKVHLARRHSNSNKKQLHNNKHHQQQAAEKNFLFLLKLPIGSSSIFHRFWSTQISNASLVYFWTISYALQIWYPLHNYGPH